MKYFLDQEFLEGTQTRRYLGMPSNIAFPLFGIALTLIAYASMYFEAVTWLSVLFALIGVWFGRYGFLQPLITKPTIDLISIGIVAEDGRELYLISKDFNLREAFSKEWIRENVLRPIYNELANFHISCYNTKHEYFEYAVKDQRYLSFTYKNLKWLINKYGYTNAEIAEKVKEFIQPIKFGSDGLCQCNCATKCPNGKVGSMGRCKKDEVVIPKPEFYGYYAAYDWVAFCWLFGKMIDLPTGFPMYCRDLKQMLDNKVKSLPWLYGRDCWTNKNMSVYNIGSGEQQEKDRSATFEEKLKRVKELVEYPKNPSEHSAIHDARWNKELYHFIEKL